jgi:hypothetical protein
VSQLELFHQACKWNYKERGRKISAVCGLSVFPVAYRFVILQMQLKPKGWNGTLITHEIVK